jgi:hypothetical protein
MIYNIQQYLESNLTNEIIFANTRKKISPNEDIPDRNVLIMESPGTSEAWTGWTAKGMQVITRDIDMPKARKLAWDVFDFLNDKFSITLNAITIDGNIYPAIEILQISANSEPDSIGDDEQGLSEFSTNYRIIYRRK